MSHPLGDTIEEWLSMGQVQQRLTISASTLRKWGVQGVVRRCFVSGRRFPLYALSDVLSVSQTAQIDFPAGYYTAGEAKAALGNISEDTFRSWVEIYHIRRIQHAKRKLYGYSQEDCAAVLAARQVKAEGELARQHPDSAQFATLYARLFDKAVRYVRASYLFASAAEDIVQNAFLALWRLEAGFFARFPDEKGQADGVFVQVRHSVSEYLRTEQRHGDTSGKRHRLLPEEMEHVIPSGEPDILKQIIDREHWLEVLARLQQFPPTTQIMMLLVAQGFGYQEITTILKERCQVIWTEAHLAYRLRETRKALADVA